MRKALVGFFICVAILALTRVIPRPASRAGMVFLVAADASGQVYTTYGNYSAVETCNALLGATPAPGRGLHLECRDLGGRSIPPSTVMVVTYALAILLGPTLEALSSAVTLAAIPLRGPLGAHPIFWRLARGASAVLTEGPTGWVAKWVFARLGDPPTLLVVAGIGVAGIVAAGRGPGRTLEVPGTRARQRPKARNLPSE